MNPYFRYFAMIGVALVLGVAIFLTGQMKPDDSKTFMGVGGDPRMRLCDSPANGELANMDVLTKMNIASPLVQADTDKAAYRVSVLRPAGQESLSITMVTPKTTAGKVTVTRWSGTEIATASADLDVPDAATLIFAFKDAKIWDDVKPTIETLARSGLATSVIEVRAPGLDRCVTTRFDDERVRPLLDVFVTRVGPLVSGVPLAGLQAPQARFVPISTSTSTSKNVVQGQ
jgi:hypothetical protein